MSLRQNTWKLNQWYDQDVAGNVSYSGIGQLFSVGDNSKGALGQNNLTKYSSPVQIPGTTWSAISARGNGGTEHVSLAVKTDGTLWSWGYNNFGMLGHNNRTNYSSPVQVGSGTDWVKDQKAISNGANTFAIKTDGTLWSWGYGEDGGLGQNDNVYRSSPVQIPGTTWSKVSGGTRRGAFGIKTDNSLWGWGNNGVGALGQNDRTNYSSPKQIPGDWATIASGAPSGVQLATKTDGTLWTWGVNEYGQLGQNNTTVRSSPVQVPGTTWNTGDSKMAVSAASAHAIKTDGTLWSWGANYFGILSQNNEIYYSSPVQVPGTTWNTVACSYVSAYATKTDGTVWSMGSNANGQLGQNNTAHKSSPVQIPGTTWVQIGTSYNAAHFLSQQ